MLLTGKKWLSSGSNEENDALSVVDVLLNSRGITEEADKEEFLAHNPSAWHDPFLLPDMKKAVDILADAISEKKRILVYGDYDCDGVTATSIMIRYLRSHHCNAFYLVPHRAEHGYGLTERILPDVYAKNPDLVITVDCGITNNEMVDEIRSHGIKVIVTDHHTCKEVIPDADAVVCAKRPDCIYPFKDLCGAGIALKFVEAMGRDGRYKLAPDIWKQVIEMAGIATIADLVSVVDENRTIVKKALQSMEKPSNLGVKIMNEMLLGSGKTPDETFISFNFVPRINAAGRLYDSSESLKLFLSNDREEVKRAANELTRENDERKQIESVVFEEAKKQVENPGRPEKWKLINTCGPIVVYGKNWHQGVLGIVAGKLSQYFRRSAIVFTDDSCGNGNVKGSARAFGDYDIYNALEEVSDSCVGFGGHKRAAGIVVAKEKLSEFMERLEVNAVKRKAEKEDEDSDNDDDVLHIACKVGFDIIGFDLYREVDRLSPFGIGNKRPVLETDGLVIANMNAMGNGSHVRFDLTKPGSNGSSVSAVGFGMSSFFNIYKPGDKVDIAYTINIFNYRGEDTISLHLEDVRPAMNGNFMWEKADIVEKLYTEGMDINQISKLARVGNAKESFVPDADAYKACYITVNELCKDGELSTFDMELLAMAVMKKTGITVTPFEVRRCLDVFEEAGLLKLAQVESNRASISLTKAEGKPKLNMTETYRRLSAV